MAARNNLITVSSGKGGVGKTWFSITLAHALALQGKRVLLIDADVSLANVDIQLGIVPAKDLGHVLCEQILVKDAIICCQKTGFDLIAGRSGSGLFSGIPMVFLNKIMKEIQSISKGYDWVIIDAEAGIGQTVKEFAKASFTNIVILNEEPTSLTDAYALIKVTRILNPHIVITNTSTPDQGKNIFNALSKATHKFMGIAPTYLGDIQKDPNVQHVIRLQTPILSTFPQTHASVMIKQIAQTICMQRETQSMVRS